MTLNDVLLTQTRLKLSEDKLQKAHALLRRIAASNVTHTEMLDLQEEARELLGVSE